MQRDRQNPNIPNIMVIVSPKMKELYERFGDLVGFDLTYNVVKEKSQDNG